MGERHAAGRVFQSGKEADHRPHRRRYPRLAANRRTKATLGASIEILREQMAAIEIRGQSIEQILVDRIDDEGGPLVYALESEESLQRSLDSTFRKLHRFLSHKPD